MGAQAKLSIDPRYSAEDIVEVMTHRMGIKDCKIRQTTCSTFSFIMFTGPTLGEPRQMNVHLCSTDEGSNICTSLNLGAREIQWQTEAVEIFINIAKVLGGTLTPNDCTSEQNFIHGMVSDNDGLAFHVRNALRKGHMRDADDIIGLLWSLRSWHNIHGIYHSSQRATWEVQDLFKGVDDILNSRNN